MGTSTNGDGAFGGSVALRTKAISYNPSVIVSGSYGSFNTYNTGLTLSSGLIGRHLILDGAFHTTSTDGYIHGTAGKSGSWYGGLTWLGRSVILKYRNIGNYERTGQAWNGITAGNGDYSLMDGSYDDGSWSYTAKTGIKTYKDLYDKGLGQFNSLYERIVTGDDGLFLTDANGYVTQRYTMRDGTLWPKTTDNFWQDHNILSAAFNLSDNWKANLAAHYTHGHGYYEEFRPDNKPKKFGITDEKVKRTDFVRRKGLTQDTYGLVGSISYSGNNIDLISGFSVQNFDGNHYGFLTYIKDQAMSDRLLSGGYYKYYDSDATKLDGSAFVKGTYHIGKNWEAFADLQYRHVGYKTTGINDKFYDEGGRWYNQELNVDENYDFLNPKLGLSWISGPNHAYVSAAMSHREPSRDNFTEMASLDWDDSFRPIHYDNAPLAFSPAAILNGFIRFESKGFKAVWHTDYVSRQYLDNTGNNDRSLPAYSFSDINLSYTLRLPKLLIQEAVVGLNVGNIFNARKATSGWVYSSILEGYGHPDSNRYYQIGFIPMAGRTIMGSISLKF